MHNNVLLINKCFNQKDFGFKYMAGFLKGKGKGRPGRGNCARAGARAGARATWRARDEKIIFLMLLIRHNSDMISIR